VVLRVRGSTGSLGKTDIAKRLWRQLALSGHNAHRELPDSRPGQKVLWRFCQQLWRLSGHNTQGGLIEPELLELMRLRGANLNACTYCTTVRLQPVANSVKPKEAALGLRDNSGMTKLQALECGRGMNGDGL
jgi:hypothetical protein